MLRKGLSMEEINLLAIETAREACSVALLRGGRVASSSTTLRPRSHAELLVPMALQVVSESGLPFSEIKAIAVSAGPGSYTGLRIGVSAAKGFATAYGAHLVGVPTLQAYALSAAETSALYGHQVDVVAIALKARQTELYFGVFETSTVNEPPVAIVETSVLELAEAAERVSALANSRQVSVGGDAADALCAAVQAPQNVDTVEYVPSAVPVARIGSARLRAGHFDDLGSFEPYYLKDYVVRDGKSMFERLSK